MAQYEDSDRRFRLKLFSLHGLSESQPVNAHKLLDRSLQNVADLFELGNEHYLIVVVYYSTYFKLGRMPTTTSTTFPEKVVPDKGPQPPFEYNWAYVVVGI